MRKILAASLGNCVHVAGVLNFLRAAERVGYETVFLGAATDVDAVLDAADEGWPGFGDVGALVHVLPCECAGAIHRREREECVTSSEGGIRAGFDEGATCAMQADDGQVAGFRHGADGPLDQR